MRKKANLEDVCIHTLRHTFATLSTAAGTDLYVVQSQLGHASYKTTQRYAHISPQRIKTATEKVARRVIGNDCSLGNGLESFVGAGCTTCRATYMALGPEIISVSSIERRKQ